MSVRFYQRGKQRLWQVRGTLRGPKGRRIKVYESLGHSDWAIAEPIWATRQTELLEELIYGQRATVSFERCADDYLAAESRSDRTGAFVDDLKTILGRRALHAIDQDAADEAAVILCGAKAPAATKRRAVYTPLTAILNHGAVKKWCAKPALRRERRPDATIR